MYAIGQTLFDKKRNEIVLYIGIHNLKKIWIKTKDGEDLE